MIDGEGQTISRRRFPATGSLFVAGVLLASVAIVIASAESLNRPVLRVLQWFSPGRTLVVVGACAVAVVLPVFRVPLRRAADAAASVPVALALAILVTSGTALQVVRGARKLSAFVLADELIYSDLAKSFAIHGRLLLRGSSHLGHSVLYPVVTSPFFVLANDTVSALVAVKTVQSLLMAGAAVPTYFIARRVVSHGWSLAVAALAALAPWSGFAALFMTEALFLPSFLALALVLALTLERPTISRQLGSVALAVVLALIRPQAFALLPAILTAVVVYTLSSGSLRRAGAYRLMLGAVGALTVAAVVVLLFAERAPGGAYGALFDDFPSLTGLAKWTVWNLADFALALGVVALAAFPLALAGLLRPSASSSERALGAVALSLFAWVGLSAVILSASEYGLGWVHERSIFYLVPLILVCFAHWLAGGLRRPPRATAACALAAVGVLAAFPPRLVTHSNALDATALAPINGLLQEHPTVSARVWLIAAAVAGALVLLAARSAVVPFATVVVPFVVLSGTLAWDDDFTADQARRLSWVDASLPPGATATLLHIDLSVDPRETCWEDAELEQQRLALHTEFFNIRVDRVLHLYGPIGQDGLASPELKVAERGGTLLTARGQTLDPEYVVVDTRQPIAGVRLRRFDLAAPGFPLGGGGSSLTLWRAEAPLRVGPLAFPAPPRPDGRPC